jgi:hypothetical protein
VACSRVNFTFTQRLAELDFWDVMICSTIIHSVLKLYDSYVLLLYGIYLPSGSEYKNLGNCDIMSCVLRTATSSSHITL